MHHMVQGRSGSRLALAALLLMATGRVLLGAVAEHDRDYYRQKTQEHVFTNSAGKTMAYRLFVPPLTNSAERLPLVLHLHGAGSRGDNNTRQLKPWVMGWIDEGVQTNHPCFILIPQCPTGKRWVDQPWRTGSYSMAKTPITESLLLAKEILDETCRTRPVDPKRIYVVGESMGGYGAWYFAATYPDVVAAAAAVCGAGDPSTAETLKNIPIWAFHGDQDVTVPPSGSRDMVEAIRKAGGTKVNLTMYPGVDHSSFKLAWKEQELIDWMFRQRK